MLYHVKIFLGHLHLIANYDVWTFLLNFQWPSRHFIDCHLTTGISYYHYFPGKHVFIFPHLLQTSVKASGEHLLNAFCMKALAGFPLHLWKWSLPLNSFFLKSHRAFIISIVFSALLNVSSIHSHFIWIFLLISHLFPSYLFCASQTRCVHNILQCKAQTK